MKSAILLLLAKNARSTYLTQLDSDDIVDDNSIYQARIAEESDYENLISEADPSKPDKFGEVSQLSRIF